ncbi:radical SAM protein [Romboutsia sedimentorum]|uniref:Radical SAM protein n=1 Tax=Romboutsia sedimentorum TaxID=1368474 RepID=A0ABT7EDQ1_9FIRM|nr:radical SAM protein [Romboutsia sedimentorum]MDK2565051.1 radical SAM protein [Romboutsia sedimentorum]
MEKKYFNTKISDLVINKNIVIISNNFTGKWIKIPIECYKVIKYSIDQGISINEVITAFKQEEDKNYFKEVIQLLDNIGLLSNKQDNDLKISFIPKVVFSITNRCNLNCDYCCVDSCLENTDTLTTQQIKTSIDNILKLNPQRIVLSGGEPFLRKDFFEIFEYLKGKYDGKIIICTNATLIKEKDIEYIAKNAYSIEISLDGFDEESCAKVRGKGVFNKVVRNIKLLKENGMKNIGLSMVVGNQNAYMVDDFYRLNRNLGTKPTIRQFSAIGRGKDSLNEYLENEKMVHYINENIYTDLSKIKSDYCQAGSSQIFVNYDGNIYVCPLLQYEKFKIGNILNFDNEAIEKLFKRDLDAIKNFNNLKPKNIDSCKKCEINIFCTGCPAKMYTLLENKEVFEYNCKHMKKILLDKIF